MCVCVCVREDVYNIETHNFTAYEIKIENGRPSIKHIMEETGYREECVYMGVYVYDEYVD